MPLASRFRMLNRIALSPEKAEVIVLCVRVLHNYLITGKRATNYIGFTVDDEDGVSHEVRDGPWSCGIPHNNISGMEPKKKREQLMRFCSSAEGAVSWQDDICK